MKRWLLVGLLLAGCIQQPPPPQVARPTPKARARLRCAGGLQLTFNDALGEPVHLGAPGQERVTIVLVMSRPAQEEDAEFVQELDEKLLNQPVDVVGIVDVRKYGGLISHGIASKKIKQGEQEARAGRRKRRQERGVEASDEYVNRWHLVGDFDGKLLTHFGVKEEPYQPVAFVVDRCGRVSPAHNEVSGVLAAVAHAAPKRAARKAPASRASSRARVE
jgi:hypothetical protein